MTGAEVPGRLRAFFEAAVPDLAVLEPGDDPLSIWDRTLLLSTSEIPPVASGDRVATSVRIGTAGSGEELSIGVMGGALSDQASAVLDAIAGADRDDSPTEPLDRESGAVLYCLARARRSRRALEIGTGAGASTVWLASAAAGTVGRVISIERDSAMRVLARRNLRSAGLLERVDLRLGEAERLLPVMYGTFDLVLFHEDPADRTDDFEMVLPSCAPGALLVSPGGRRRAKQLSVYNATVRSHPAVRASVDLATAAGLKLTLMP